MCDTERVFREARMLGLEVQKLTRNKWRLLLDGQRVGRLYYYALPDRWLVVTGNERFAGSLAVCLLWVAEPLSVPA